MPSQAPIALPPDNRLHSSLGMISPTEYEAAHYADPHPLTD
ncbi:hypothetical protein GCM10010278_37270 [Streptomyces melanogenes]|nr:hypothetical protein GCM10010278_37270 [Streptomyces melanogenes]